MKTVCHLLVNNIVILTHILSRTVSDIQWIIGLKFAVEGEHVPLCNPFVRSEPLNSGLESLSSINYIVETLYS